MLQLQIIIVVDMYLNAIFKNKILRIFFEFTVVLPVIVPFCVYPFFLW